MFCLFSVEEKVEGMLYQMMAGACETLKESNCALVGGHTAEGKTRRRRLVVVVVVDCL
jgi:phosphoribosylaminoimidazole (AIR) synthetase